MVRHLNRSVGYVVVLGLLLGLNACSTISTDSGGSDGGTATNSNSSSSISASGNDNSASTVAQNGDSHEDTDDYAWDGTIDARITLADDAITVEGDGAVVDGNAVTITAAGSYEVSGKKSNGQVRVDTDDEGAIRIILDGVQLASSSTAPLLIEKADKAIIILSEGSENRISDSASYSLDPESDEPNAALFSKSDMTIYGSGVLSVEGNYNDGITSKDGLVIESGTITVTAVDDAIRGKDYIVVHDGTIVVSAGGDGLKADNDVDSTLGYIAVDGGTFEITAGGDAIAAQTDVAIADGQFILASGGGSDGAYNTAVSGKGIKGLASVVVDGGAFEIDSADDGLHSNGTMSVNGGDFTVATGDDGLHADGAMTITGGAISISRSYEGIESNTSISISGGTMHIVSRDDGVNVANGNDLSGLGGPGFPGGGGRFPASEVSSTDLYLDISGGYLYVDADGDGIDANGAVTMSGGVVLVDGPTADDNGALDHQSFAISGGLLVAVGSARMAQAPDSNSTQRSVAITFSQAKAAGTMIHIENSTGGSELLSFVPAKTYQSFVFSSPDLAAGTSYALYSGGSSSGAETDGLYEGGAYTPGSLTGTFTLSSVVTSLSAP